MHFVGEGRFDEVMEKAKDFGWPTRTIVVFFPFLGLGVVAGVIIGCSMSSYVVFNHDLATQSLALIPSSSSPSAFSLREWIEPGQVMHSMSDKEVNWRASMVPLVVKPPFKRVRKVAFMFLTRGRIPLRRFWELFFKGNEGLYNVYVHSPPYYHAQPPNSSVFHHRRIPSKVAEWGKPSMFDAERRLLANALLDFSNEWFVLLSESCIPLFNFSTIYHHLMNSRSLSYVDITDDPGPNGRGRYNKRMSPVISIANWRKGSQWFAVHRKLALEVVSDTKYYPRFVKFCKEPCYVDEHYLPTFVHMRFGGMNAGRSLTWVDWSRGGSHPAVFGEKDVTVWFLNKMRFGTKCLYNGKKTSLCHLFARKIAPSALGPLMRVGPSLMSFTPY